MHQKPKNKIIGAFLGTIIEYYDYSLYGFSAAIIAAKFFPNIDPIIALMNVFAVYAFSYLAKPIGSLLFGYIGDSYGRKIALSITIIGIAIPTTIIGTLPEYSKMGVSSTIILIMCRFVQSIFAAGEYDGAAIYVIEHLGPKYYCFASAITRSMGVIGLLAGIAATNFFSAHIFPEWGWRVPFLLSLPLSLVTIYYRQRLHETPEFVEDQLNNSSTSNKDFASSKNFKSIIKLIKQEWRSLFIIIMLAGSCGATYQVSVIFMKQYLPIVLPQSSIIISTFSILLVMCFGIVMPISGFIADKIGPGLVIRFSACAAIASAALLAIGIKYQMLNLSLAAALSLAGSVAPFNALAHGIAVKIFKVSQRYRAIALGHTTGSMLMSGTANYLCLLFMTSFGLSLFPIIYVCLFSIIVYILFTLYENKLIIN